MIGGDYVKLRVLLLRQSENLAVLLLLPLKAPNHRGCHEGHADVTLICVLSHRMSGKSHTISVYTVSV